MLLLRKRRICRPAQKRKESYPLSWMFMAAGYLLGCVIGVIVAIRADVSWLTNIRDSSVDSFGRDLVSALCGYAAYGLAMLLLATSYLGFFLIPGVFAVKGFLSGSVFTVWIRGDAASGLLRACAELMLPGVFLLSAMLVMGQLCMSWSVRLYRIRSGETVPRTHGAPRMIAAASILLLFSSAIKTYLVPYLLGVL